MRRVRAVLAFIAFLCVTAAAPAVAQTQNYPPQSPQPAGEVAPAGAVAPTGGAGPGEIAFTGANITIGMIIVAALLVAGVAALLLSRRRTAPSK